MIPGPRTDLDEVSSALEAHVLRYSGLLDHAIRRYGLPWRDREELIQEVRLKLWLARRTGAGISGICVSYMYRTVMSAAVDLARRSHRESRGTSLVEPRRRDVDPRLSVSLADPVEAAEVLTRIELALQKLAAPRRIAVRLYLRGYTRQEIERLLGWSEARARNLLYRGLSDLRGRLGDLGVGPDGERPREPSLS